MHSVSSKYSPLKHCIFPWVMDLGVASLYASAWESHLPSPCIECRVLAHRDGEKQDAVGRDNLGVNSFVLLMFICTDVSDTSQKSQFSI